ncbi:hypothetical protein [Trinickia sp. EG282A]|uniref:hypothetical protein n=1 Tax=Trinickia sp. EG282A TaxID=3237013 RepID=UPI0034D204C1
MLDAAEQYSREAFPSAKEFLRRLYDFEIYHRKTAPWNPVCVTGLPGGGKTSIFVAATRLLEDDTVNAGAGHVLPLLGFRHLTIEDERSELGILRRTCWAFNRQWSGTTSSAHEKTRLKEDDGFPMRDLKRARDTTALVGFRSGCCGVMVDEMQYMTQSTTANTLVTKSLLELSYLRFPFFFAANFNLVAKLLARPPQDRDRLLSNPVVVLPDTVATEISETAWKNYIRECKRVAGGVLDFDVDKDAESLVRYTFGLRRKFVIIIKSAYGRAREAGRFAAGMSDIEEAYKSTAYYTHRKDVESLIAMETSGKKEQKEFVCPIEVDSTEAMARHRMAQEEQGRAVAEQMVIDSLSPAGRLAYQQAGGPKPDAGEKSKGSGRVKTPVSSSSLLAGSDQFHRKRK